MNGVELRWDCVRRDDVCEPDEPCSAACDYAFVVPWAKAALEWRCVLSDVPLEECAGPKQKAGQGIMHERCRFVLEADLGDAYPAEWDFPRRKR